MREYKPRYFAVADEFLYLKLFS